MSEVAKLKDVIKTAKKIVFFGGAGVSTSSGIPDFRGEKGLYAIKSEYGVSYETMLSHSYYVDYPETFFDFYKKKMLFPDALPNKAHTCLVKLEEMGKDVSVVTQNIDGLHQLAGSKKVIELHGSVLRNYCEKCHTFFDLDHIINSKAVPLCSKCGGRVKPDVVLYEEPLDSQSIQEAVEAIAKADLIIVGGTSLNVYPAAGLIRYRKQGSCLTIINYERTNYDSYADIVIHDDIGKTLEAAIE